MLLDSAAYTPGFDVFASKLVSASDPSYHGIGDAYKISGMMWRTGQSVPLTFLK